VKSIIVTRVMDCSGLFCVCGSKLSVNVWSLTSIKYYTHRGQCLVVSRAVYQRQYGAFGEVSCYPGASRYSVPSPYGVEDSDDAPVAIL